MKKKHHYNNYNQNPRHNHNNFNDPFGLDDDDDDFGFGIHEDFDDPFEHMMMGGFGFPNMRQIHQRLLGQMGGGDMGENEEFDMRHNNNTGIQRGGGNRFQSYFSMQGMGPGAGTVITKSYSSKIDYRDGQPHQECYQSQSINQIGSDGHKISEKQEAYKNSRTGVQKAAHQRILDDKGMKQIRQRNVNTGEQEEHNIFKGMREEELNNFNQNYNDYRNKIGFQKNYKYLNQMNPYKRGKSQNYIGNGIHQGVNRNQRQPMLLGDGSEQPNNQQHHNNINNINNNMRIKVKKPMGKKINKK